MDAGVCQTCGARIETHGETCELFGRLPTVDAVLRARLIDTADYRGDMDTVARMYAEIDDDLALG